MDLTESAEEKGILEAIKAETTPPGPEKVAEVIPAIEKPAEAAAATTPVVETPKAPEKKPDERPRLVPHAALHEERERRKELERRLAALEKPAAPTAQAVPDETTDPLGAISSLKAKIADFEQQQQYAYHQAAAEQHYALKANEWISSYKPEHPEYDDQANYLYSFRMKQLGIQYPQLAEPIRAQLANREAQALFREAIDNDVNPAELVAQHAVIAGWRAKEADPTPTPTTKADSKPAVEKIERLNRGQKAAISSSGSGGGAERAEMTIEELLDLDGAAFDKAAKAFIDAGKRSGM